MYEAALAEPRRAGEYVTALCDALLEILGHKIHDLPGILNALDASDVKPSGGGAWTENFFTAEMARMENIPIAQTADS